MGNEANRSAAALALHSQPNMRSRKGEGPMRGIRTQTRNLRSWPARREILASGRRGQAAHDRSVAKAQKVAEEKKLKIDVLQGHIYCRNRSSRTAGKSEASVSIRDDDIGWGYAAEN